MDSGARGVRRSAREMGSGARAIAAAVLSGALLLSGCSGSAAARTVPGGNPEAGKAAIQAYGCGSCHTVPGVRGANGVAAPPLTRFALRSFIAGEVANTSANLIRWIQAPQSMAPKTAMPDLDVTAGVARDIAAYLYTLQ